MEFKVKTLTIGGPAGDRTFLYLKGVNKKDGCDIFKNECGLKEIKNSYCKLAFYDIDIDTLYRWSNLFKVWIIE